MKKIKCTNDLVRLRVRLEIAKKMSIPLFPRRGDIHMLSCGTVIWYDGKIWLKAFMDD